VLPPAPSRPAIANAKALEPDVSHPIVLRTRWASIEVAPNPPGSPFGAEVRVSYLSEAGGIAGTFRLVPPPSAGQAAQIQALLEVPAWVQKPIVAGPERFRQTLTKLYGYVSSQTESCFEPVADSRKAEFSPVQPMTPFVDSIEDLVANPDLARRQFECSRAFGSLFCRMSGLIDKYGMMSHIKYSVTDVSTRETSEFSFSSECRSPCFEIVPNRHASGDRQDPVAALRSSMLRAMSGFYLGDPDQMGSYGPYFKQQLEKLAPSGKRLFRRGIGAPDRHPDKDIVSRRPSDDQIWGGDFDKFTADVVAALPGGGKALLSFGERIAGLKVTGGPTPSAQDCLWLCDVPSDDPDVADKVRARLKECVKSLKTGSYQKTLLTHKKLIDIGATLIFSRVSFSHMLGDNAEALHKAGVLLVEQVPGNSRELFRSTVAGEAVLKLWIPQAMESDYSGNDYVTMKLTSLPDGALEVCARDRNRRALEARFSAETVESLGGLHEVSADLAWAFHAQQGASRFALESACRRMLPSSDVDDSWLMIGARNPFSAGSNKSRGDGEPRGPEPT